MPGVPAAGGMLHPRVPLPGGLGNWWVPSSGPSTQGIGWGDPQGPSLSLQRGGCFPFLNHQPGRGETEGNRVKPAAALDW